MYTFKNIADDMKMSNIKIFNICICYYFIDVDSRYVVGESFEKCWHCKILRIILSEDIDTFAFQKVKS